MLATDALICWRHWDAGALRRLCDGAPADADQAGQADTAWWRALAALMDEDADALEQLAAAHEGFAAAGDAARSAVVAHAALVVCLLDTGAMQRVRDWQERAADYALPAPGDDFDSLWLQLGRAARVALGEADSPEARLAAAWLAAQLRPASKRLSADERLIAAQVLVDYHFAVQRYEQFDFLANLVEAPAQFERASPLMRARWLYTAGYAHYQIGAHAAARGTWQRGLEVARAGGLQSQQLLSTLALARLLIDSAQLDEAEGLVDAVRPQWGAGRTAQLIELKQLRARLQLLRGQPVQALATLTDALQLGDAAGLSASEQASCQTDLAQVLIALERLDDAAALLERLSGGQGGQGGRDAQVYTCLHRLLSAHRAGDDASAAAHLGAALALAQQIRYTMFFRLLPALAARLCALALRCGVERPFVEEVIRARALAAPDDADERWPWAVWVRMLGGFELRLNGAAPAAGGKTQHKPLELLRLLACERGLALGAAAAVQALWPDAEDDAAGRKNLEMTVQRLRRLIDDATLVWVGDGRIGLDAGRVSSDVAQRRRLVERVEALAMRGNGADGGDSGEAVALALSERVLTLSGGELLATAPDAAWLNAERRRCRQETVRAALAASAVLARHGATPAERELLQRALRIEPLAESLVCRLMQSFDATGQRGDALRVFEDLRKALAERGAAPGAGTLAQWQALLQRATT